MRYKTQMATKGLKDEVQDTDDQKESKQSHPHLFWQEFSFAGGNVTVAASTGDEQKSLLG